VRDLHWLFIQPHDVWMFRDARPFTAGTEFVARSLFPPPPDTIFGALRTFALEAHGILWQNDPDHYRVPQEVLDRWGAPATKTEPAKPPQITLHGPFVARKTPAGITRLIQMPQDVVRRKDSNSYHLLTPKSADFITEAPFAGWLPLMPPDDAPYEAAQGWLDDAMLEAYLRGTPPTAPIETRHIYQFEERTGVALTGARTAREHHYYRARMVRPAEDVGLLVGIAPDSEFNTITEGTLAIGGEGRMGHFMTVTYAPPSLLASSGQLKVVTLTPAYFMGGWRPLRDSWAPWFGAEARLVSLANGRTLPISGWDMAKGKPKPLRQMVPPGSVFYFREVTSLTLPFTEVPDDKPELGRIGYGAIAAGAW
jgi:CRISPR-associated protein Cmr3